MKEEIFNFQANISGAEHRCSNSGLTSGTWTFLSNKHLELSFFFYKQKKKKVECIFPQKVNTPKFTTYKDDYWPEGIFLMSDYTVHYS